MTKEQKQMIANGVVQQYTREQGIQNLQAEIEAMNRQNGIAALQAELDAMNNSAAAQSAQSQIPSLVNTKPKRDLQAEAREYFANVRKERAAQAAEEKKRIEIEKQNEIKAAREDYQRQQQEEQMLAEKKFTAEDLERQIANSDRAVPQNKKKKLTEEQKALEEQILSADRADIYNHPEKEEKKKYSANPFMSDYLSVRTANDLGKDRKAVQTSEVIKKYAEAKGISEDQARAEFEKAEAMKGQSISAPGTRNLASLEATDKAQKDLQISKWLDPNKKLSAEEKKQAREFAQAELNKFEYSANHQPILNSDEERQHYAEMVNLLNKTSAVANTMTGVIQQPLNLARTVRDTGSAVTNGLTSFGAALGDKTGLTEGAIQRHNEAVAAKDAFYAQNDANMDQAYQNALTQNPVLTKGGQLAGNMGMYMLTNPVFDSAAAAAGLGKAGTFWLNQGAQNVQDLLLDTLPTLNRYAKDGELTDAEKFDLALNGVFNVGGNLLMGGAGLAIDKWKQSKEIPELVTNPMENTKGITIEGIGENVDNLGRSYDDYIPGQMPEFEDANGFTKNSLDNASTSEYVEGVNNSDVVLRGNENGTINKGYDGTTSTGNVRVGEQNPVLPENSGKGTGTGTNGLGNSPSTSGPVVNDVMRQKMSDAGVNDIKLRDYSNNYEAYSNALSEARKANSHGAFVDPQPVEDLQKYNAKAFMSDNGGCGVAVKDNGNIVGVFKNTDKYANPVEAAGAASDELLTARLNGGDRLDCYCVTTANKNLVNMYSPAGFEPTHKVRYERGINQEMDEWCDKEIEKWIASGKDEKDFVYPDIVFMKVRDGESVEDTLRLLKEDKIPTYDEYLAQMPYTEARDGLSAYDVAEMERDALIDRAPKQGAFFDGENTPPKNLDEIEHNKVMAEDIGFEPTKPEPGESFIIEEEIPDKGAFVEDGKSRVVTNSAINSDIVTMADLENDPVIQDIATYAKHNNDTTFAEAYDRVKLKGKQWKNDYISGAKAISDDTDVDTSMLLLQDLKKKMDNATDPKKAELYANERNALLRKLREYGTRSGQGIQAFAKWNNTADGALLNATQLREEDIIKPWISRNKKAVEHNSRIAKALADMGHKPDVKVKPELTHDQIKKGVIAEIEREVGSVEKYFNDNDIEFLTQMAEDKKIPVWQITSEIEHKLSTGDWYTLDESTPIPKPTNTKLQGALNSLIENEVRATEKTAPTLQQITEEVRNTLAKEAADFEGQFTDNDIDYIANLINNGATKNEVADALNVKMATGNFGLSEEVQQQVNDLFKQASMYDPNSKQFVEAQAEAYALLANEILPNATAAEKFEAWRYLAMLGNPKTMLRNLVGNTAFNVVTSTSNGLAAMIEAGVDKGIKGGKKLSNKFLNTGFDTSKGIQRTKSILNPFKDSDLIKASWQDADVSRYRQIIGSKYEKFDKNSFRKHKSVFDSKLLQLYEKATDAGISDYTAVKTKFSTSLAGYLKANGYDTSIFKAEDELARLKNLSETRLLSDAERDAVEKLSKDVAELEKARDYALKQAEYATFHEDNKMAQVLSEWSKLSKEKGTGLGHILIEGTIPFKKTPANVLRSGYEYSPLGAISSLKKTGKLIIENTGKNAGNLADTYINSAGKEVKKTLANEVIESWSKTLTGTGLTALGFYLYNKGALLDSDKETKKQDQLEGRQNYSIKIGNKTYTIDWAAPAAMPLLLGAELSKVWNAEGKDTENWYDNLDEYLNAVNMIAEPLVETSMLSGVRDSLKEIASSAKNGDYSGLLTTAGYNMATGYLSQAIPTLSGQIARTVDNTRRSTYTDKEGVAGALERQFRKTMNKLPGLSKLNQPYVDAYGREQKNSPSDNPLLRFAYQMASPGYLANVNTTAADTMSRGVYDISKNEKTLPQLESTFKDSNGKRVSPEDYTIAAKASGKANYEIRNALANDEWFNGLDDAQKEKIVEGINTIAEHAGNAAIDPEYAKDSSAFNAYKDGGIPSLLDYYKDQNAKSFAKETGFDSDSAASKAIQEDIKNGDVEEAQAKKDDAKILTDLGLTKPGPSATWYKAKESSSSYIPKDAESFGKMYKEIDTDNSQGIKQEEFFNYANRKITSEQEAQEICDLFGWKNKAGKKLKVIKKNNKWTGTYDY